MNKSFIPDGLDDWLKHYTYSIFLTTILDLKHLYSGILKYINDIY